jgi:hypothetical protein
MPKIITYENVKDFFEENNCKLLTEKKDYENIRTKLLFKCHCGEISDIQYRTFQNTKKCKYCSNIKKYNYEDVKKYFEDNGCQLLTSKEDYINVKVKVEYICICKNKSEITFDNFKNGLKRCMYCANNKACIKKLTYKDVENIFIKKECLLITQEYKNNQQILKYKCKCGMECHSTLKNFTNLKNTCKHN